MSDGLHFVNGVGCDNPVTARSVQSLFAKAGITSRADLKTFIATGSLPAATTITAPVFQRALLILGTAVRFEAETEASAADSGV